MNGDTEYNKWSKENAHKYWVPDEPLTGGFAISPWEGEFSYNLKGEYVQYRNGEWVKVD
jgi:hypothetical protein